MKVHTAYLNGKRICECPDSTALWEAVKAAEAALQAAGYIKGIGPGEWVRDGHTIEVSEGTESLPTRKIDWAA